MRKGSVVLSHLFIALLGLSLLLAVVPLAGAQDAVVHFYFFYSEECDHCQEIKNEFLPTLLAQYDGQIEINYLEISSPVIYEQMLALERQYNVSLEQADIPEVFVGEYALLGPEAIKADLPGLIDQYLAGGGTDLASLPAAATAEPGKAVARFYLFYGETCPHCHEIMDNYLPQVYEKYGDQVEYEYIEVWSSTDNYLTLLGLLTKLEVPEEQRGYVPVLVIGDKVMVGADEIPAKLESYIDEYLAQGGVDYPSLDDLPQVELPTPVPTVQILFIYDPEDADSERLLELINSLGEKHANGFQAFVLDVSQADSAGIAAQINTTLGVEVPVLGTPQVLIDRRMLVGIAEIESKLPGLVEQYLAEGGRNLPPIEELLGDNPSSTATPIPATPLPAITETAPVPIYIAYFEQAGCQECARTNYDLRVIEERYPQIVVERFPTEERENIPLNECLSAKYGVPEEKRLSTPMLFIGDDVLIGTEANLQNLLTVVDKYAATGTERTWGDCDLEESEQKLIDRFKRWGVFTILGAGLIDGLNPCAFATLVFFISYLTFTGRRGRDILFVGTAFALGVFLTYLLVGVGLMRVIQSLDSFESLGRWVYVLTALLCLVLAILTFRDFFRAREGRASEMVLKLPLNLRRRINKVIRENAQTRAFVAMAFVTGFVVSLIELACTGQVFLPTIVYVTTVPDYADKAFLYLVLYCLMFIVPLIVVFGLSYFGTTSEQLGQFVNRHTSTIKLVTGLVFVGLALWMTWAMAPLFGIHNPWNWLLMGGVLVVIIVAVVVLYFMDKRAPPKPAPRRRSRRSRA